MILNTYSKLIKLMGGCKMTKYEQLQEHLKSNQNTWLVTGVAGFIGSNLLEKLLILNQKVVALSSYYFINNNDTK